MPFMAGFINALAETSHTSQLVVFCVRENVAMPPNNFVCMRVKAHRDEVT